MFNLIIIQFLCDFVYPLLFIRLLNHQFFYFYFSLSKFLQESFITVFCRFIILQLLLLFLQFLLFLTQISLQTINLFFQFLGHLFEFFRINTSYHCFGQLNFNRCFVHLLQNTFKFILVFLHCLKLIGLLFSVEMISMHILYQYHCLFYVILIED